MSCRIPSRFHTRVPACTPRVRTRRQPTGYLIFYAFVAVMIEKRERLTGVETRRIYLDRGYRGPNYPHRFSVRVGIGGQVRRVTAAIRRGMGAVLPSGPPSDASRPSTA